jgi:hypothetical protein
LSLAIDTLANNERTENMEKPIQIKLLKFYVRRTQCYMKMAESFGKIRYARSALQDCHFIGNNRTFESIIKDVTLDRESLFDILRQIQMKANEFIATKEEIEANLEAQRNVILNAYKFFNINYL